MEDLLKKLHAWKPKYPKAWLNLFEMNKKEAIVNDLFSERKIAA